MGRQINWGVPERSKSYVYPVDDRRVLWGSILVGGGFLLIFALLHSVGLKRVASPGDVASPHSPIDSNCAQCHQSFAGVSNGRCSRCHDREVSLRLTNNAHVLFGSHDSRKAEQARELDCTLCHAEHRGRAFDLKLADARECAGCHEFSSLERHPEFAAVQAGLSAGGGIKFDHDRHIRESEKSTGQRCGFCHVMSAETGSFGSLSFDTQCARCHLKADALTGSTDPIDLRYVILPENMPLAQNPSRPLAFEDVARGRKQVSGFRHRDLWVLYNLLYLRRQIEPNEELAERLALQARVAWLSSQSEIGSRGYQYAEPQATLSRLARDIAAIDRQTNQPRDRSQEIAALKQQFQWTDSLLSMLNAPGASNAAGDDATFPDPERSTADSNGESGQLGGIRQDEIKKLLDSVSARGEPALSKRANDLKAEIESGPAAPGSGGADRPALLDMLARLDDVLAQLGSVRHTGLGVEVARLSLLRDLGVELVGEGLAPAEFDSRRSQVVTLLAVLEQRGPGEIASRARDLRQRVLGLRAGSLGDDSLRQTRLIESKLLELVRLDRELGSQPELSASPRAFDRSGANDARLRQRLSDRLVRLNLATPNRFEGDTEAAQRTLTALLGPCMKCHEVPGADLAMVWVEDSVMPRARFDHRPHVRIAKCESCHATIIKSRKASDANVPGVAWCLTCHGKSGARSDCALCHFYHPKSPSAFSAIGP